VSVLSYVLTSMGAGAGIVGAVRGALVVRVVAARGVGVTSVRCGAGVADTCDAEREGVELNSGCVGSGDPWRAEDLEGWRTDPREAVATWLYEGALGSRGEVDCARTAESLSTVMVVDTSQTVGSVTRGAKA
jgi:hypothetical protein